MDGLARKRHQLIMRGAGLVAVMCAYMMFILRWARKNTPRITYGPMVDRDIARQSNLRFIYHSSDANCLNQLRMTRAPFFSLCSLFRERQLLQDSIHTSIEEQVAMFLLVVGHNHRFRAMQPTFRRSIEIISRYFKVVLFAVGELRDEMIRPPSIGVHPKIGQSSRFNPYFKFSTGTSKMPQVMVVAQNFMDMVAALPAAKLDTLYDSAFICEAVLRSLPPLAKKYAVLMLYVLAPVAAVAMEDWMLDEYASKHRVAIDRLLRLRIFVEVRDRRKEVSYKMNHKFQGNMQKYLVDGGSLPREPIPSSVTARLPTLAELENYALEQWECFLLQLINSSQVDRGTSFSSSMMRTFQRGLLSSRDGEAPKLTENGFQFLLMETNAQLWYIMREYISSAEERGVDPTELISFLLELGFHTLGEAYSLNTLTDVQRIAIRDLAELGLVKLQQGRKDSWFIPTKLATNLSSSLSDSSSSKEGIVVVETNFRMYAYSNSRLHCEILRLFSRVEYQLPNLIVGAITKESLYGAFENGITAEQIISFLQQNAHPRVADKIPVVPENVTDQIRLWEADRNRVEMVPSHLYEDFPSKELFEQCCDHARDNGFLLWEDTKKMRLIVRGEFHQEMREFLRRQK